MKKRKKNAIVTVNRYVFYRNVYVFVNRFKNIISFRDENKLRFVIFQCFRENAIVWHITKFSKMKKIYFKKIAIVQWKSVLIHRFKKRISIALIKFQIVRYILTDVKIEKNFKIIIQNIFRHAKTVHLNSIQNQLIMI